MAKPFLEQIPKQFMGDRVTVQFVQNLVQQQNQNARTITGQQSAIITVQNDAIDTIGQIPGPGPGPGQEQFTEQPLVVGQNEAISGFFYIDTRLANQSDVLYILLLPSSPEQDFYTRAQVFNGNILFVLSDDGGPSINFEGNQSFQTQESGAVVDIRYSLTLERYVLT